jgi:hypothetical protein
MKRCKSPRVTGECEFCGQVKDVQVFHYLGFEHLACKKCSERDALQNLPSLRLVDIRSKAAALVEVIDNRMRHSERAIAHSLVGKPELAEKEMALVRKFTEQIEQLRKEISET